MITNNKTQTNEVGSKIPEAKSTTGSGNFTSRYSPRIMPSAASWLFILSIFQLFRNTFTPTGSRNAILSPRISSEEPNFRKKELSHVLGDPYIQNAQSTEGDLLEGWHTLPALETLADLDSNRFERVKNELGEIKRDLFLVHRGHELTEEETSTLATELGTKIKHLKPGDNLWLEGGWTKAREGHAMYYRFIKKENGTYDIYIYNTGAGLEYHYHNNDRSSSTLLLEDPQVNSALEREKSYYCPFVKFEGVTSKEIGIEQNDFFLLSQLIAVQNPRFWAVRTTADPAEILYLHTFGPLNHRRVDDPRKLPDFFLTEEQLSGTCTYKVLAYAVLGHKLGALPEGEKAKLTKRHQTFDEICHKEKDELEADEKELCIQGGKELLRDLAKYYDVFLQQEEISSLKENPSKFLEWACKEPIKPLILPEGENLIYQDEPKVLSEQASYLPMAPSSETKISSIHTFSGAPLHLEKMDDLILELEKIQQFPSRKEQPLDLALQIEYLVKSLPRPLDFKRFWKEAPASKIHQCQKLLLETLDLYRNILRTNEMLLTEQNTAWALLALIHHLSVRTNPSLASHGLAFSPFAKLIEYSTFTAFHKEDLAFYKEILAYFEHLPSQTPLFDLRKANHHFWTERDPHIDLDFLQSIANSHKGLAAKLFKLRLFNRFGSESRYPVEKELISNLHFFEDFPETAYVSFLRKAAYYAQQFTYLKEGGISSSISCNEMSMRTLNSPWKHGFTIHQDFVDKKLRPAFIPKQNEAFNETWLDKQTCFFGEKSTQKENKVLLQEIDREKRLTTTTCQPTLQSFKLLNYFTDHLLDLKDTRNQNAFLLSLFGAYPSITPLHQAIRNPDFIEALSDWAKKGIALFSDLETKLFFIQVIRRVKELDPSLPLKDYSSEIESFLTRENLSQKEKELLNLHRILQHRFALNQFLHLSEEEISSSKELKQIFLSWVRSNRFIAESWQEIHAYSEVAHFIRDLAPVFARLPSKWIKQTLLELFPSKAEALKEADFQLSSPHQLMYTTDDPENSWQVYPLQGHILHNNHLFRFDSIANTLYTQLRKDQKYGMLFGEKQFPVTGEESSNPEEGILSFEDSNGFHFRMFQKKREYQHFLVIQLFWKGEWLQFLGDYFDLLDASKGYRPGTEHPLYKDISKTILVDHFIFQSKEKILFVNKKDFSIHFENLEGLVFSPSSDFHEEIKRFEQASWLLEKKNSEGFVEITFPRFVSTEQEPLEFIRKNGALCWKNDLGKLLKKNPPPILGLCKNFLWLQKGSEHSILVPVKPLDPSSLAFQPHCDLDIQDVARQEEYKKTGFSSPPFYSNELEAPQIRKYLFLEYPVEEGQPKALNTEGHLFLSYLWLAQKRYDKALEELEKVLHLKEYTGLSENSYEILSWIVSHPASSYDKSPSSAAFGLKVGLFLLRALTGIDPGAFKNFNIKDLRKKNLPTLWNRYHGGLDHVDGLLRLPEEELNELIELASSLEISLKETHPDLWKPLPISEKSSLDYPSTWGWTFCSNRGRQGFKEYCALTYHLNDYEDQRRWEEKCYRNQLKEVYEAFRTAKTPEEFVFLKIKHAFFLLNLNPSEVPIFNALFTKKTNSYKAFPNYEQMKESPCIDNMKNWYRQFKDYDNQIPYFIEPKEKQESPGLTPALPKVSKSLAETIAEARLTTPSSSFDLPFLETSSDSLVKEFQGFFHQIPSSSKENSSSKEGLFKTFSKTAGSSGIQKDREDFLKDYVKGIEKNEKEIRFSFKEGQTVDSLHTKVQQELLLLKEKSSHLKEEILSLANQSPSDKKQKEITELLLQGGALASVRLWNLEQAFLKGKSSNYLNLNPHLNAESIALLDQKLQAYLENRVQIRLMEKALKSFDPNELGNLLLAKTAYLDSSYASLKRQFLVFESRSGLKLREEQAFLIRLTSEIDGNGLYKDFLIQLIMGGGKTTAIASNLLYLAARPGRIPLFIALKEQFSSLKHILSQMQKTNFGQEVIPVNLRKEQLNIKNLSWLTRQMILALEGKAILLTTRETIEALKLEYLLELNRSPLPKDQEKLKHLSLLVRAIKFQGDGILDEADVLLNLLYESNFPVQDKTLIHPRFADLTRRCFEILLSEEFQTKISLRENKQASLSPDERKKILFEVLQRFLDTAPDIVLSSSEKEEFLSFVFEERGAFEEILARKNEEGASKQMAQDLSLLKHQFGEVLPLTLSKSHGENFGRVLDQTVSDQEEVMPFNGVSNPSFNDFGSEWEAMDYHYQTALANGITLSRLKKWAVEMYSSCQYEASSKAIPIEDAEGFKLFEKLTGVSLDDVLKGIRLDEALKTVNQNPRLQLYLEASTIVEVVGFYEQFARSTSQNFASSLSTKRSLTGTPWFLESFPQSLQDHFLPDPGTEGKIADVFLERAFLEQIHLVNQKSSVQDLLKSTLQTMTPERQNRLSGFIDTGAFFKDKDSLSVAEEILAFYEKDPRIQSVLFFGRPTPKSPMTLMALKKGVLRPITIGSTKPEEIAKHGIFPDFAFVYYGQSNAEATDIAQRKDAINAISLNHKTTRRTFMQGMLRLRKYFEGQDIEILLPQGEKHLFSNEETISHEEILLKLTDNQAFRKTEFSLRLFKQVIDNTLYQMADEQLLKAKDPEEELAIFNQYKPIFITKISSDLVELHGHADVQIDSFEELYAYRKKQEKLFASLANDLKALEKLSLSLDEVIEKAKQCPYIPAKSKKSSDSHLETQIEVSIETSRDLSTHKEQNQEQDTDLDLELQQELALYQFKGEPTDYVETAWTKKLVEKGFFVSDYSNWNSLEPKIYSLPELLENRSHFSYKQDYFKLFSKNLLISHNFLHTITDPTSIFSKQQKYAEQVLIIEEKGSLKAILVSPLEGAFFKDYIEQNQPSNMWLLLPNGKSHAEYSAPKPSSKAFKELLWEVNLFNGHVAWLLDDPLTVDKKKELDKSLLDRYLALKTRDQKFQKILFNRYFKEHQDDLEQLRLLTK
jgi:hypothetical protein